ncbi:MAG: transketolase family protein [Oscillospiraceae bacterium]|nr:transketolase family protein [Candidatus Limimonas coprohippi]MCQ2487972.1 transketolase family protein [Clostridia bacterium]
MGGMSYTSIEAEQLTTAEYYGKALHDLGELHPDVVALTADLAKSTKIAPFVKAFPDRLINVGIAEQNMFGIAAGMAKCGFVPYASTFSIFAAARSLDQIHTDICYQNVPVKILASHAGTSFGQAGSTHHAIIDIAAARSLPNMTVMCPADGAEAYKLVMASYDIPGPVYIRINRGFDAVVYEGGPDSVNFVWDKADELKKGNDACFIGVGAGVYQALQASNILEYDCGVKARVLNMHTVKPIDKEAIIKAIDETGCIVTVEDHVIQGGLGSAVAEVIAEYGKPCKFKMLGHDNSFSTIGLQEDLLTIAGIDANGVAKAAAKLLNVEIGGKDDWENEY